MIEQHRQYSLIIFMAIVMAISVNAISQNKESINEKRINGLITSLENKDNCVPSNESIVKIVDDGLQPICMGSVIGPYQILTTKNCVKKVASDGHSLFSIVNGPRTVGIVKHMIHKNINIGILISETKMNVTKMCVTESKANSKAMNSVITLTTQYNDSDKWCLENMIGIVKCNPQLDEGAPVLMKLDNQNVFQCGLFLPGNATMEHVTKSDIQNMLGIPNKNIPTEPKPDETNSLSLPSMTISIMVAIFILIGIISIIIVSWNCKKSAKASQWPSYLRTSDQALYTTSQTERVSIPGLSTPPSFYQDDYIDKF